jgi:cobyrinic acid a,c-diamide synthase
VVTIPRVVIAAPGSGHGKTSVATGLLAALRQRGLAVSPHKVGPDYIDPGYHALAAGRAGRNLDPWLTGADHVVPMFLHGATTPVPADIAVIEGVMGLFDGKAGGASEDTADESTGGDFASTAHVARLLAAPVALVMDASGMAASAAAVLHGFATFDSRARVAGVIFNKVGTPRHEQLLRDAADAAGIPVLGVIPRLARLTVPSRHLGLIPAAELGAAAQAAVSALAAVITAHVDLPAVLRLARSAGPLPAPRDHSPQRSVPAAPFPRLALAAGPAFTFGYPEHAELLTAAGAEVVTVDPLREERLPDGTDGLVIGGGFPEEHAGQLSANESLRAQVAALAAAGAPVIAECAGLLYLARSLDGHPMCGVLDVEATMTPALTLGYRDAVAAADSPLAPAGTRARGHEFHRTAVTPARRADGEDAALASGGYGGAHGVSPREIAAAWHWMAAGTAVAEGFVHGGVHASYLHTHWQGIPGAAPRVVAAARRHAAARRRRGLRPAGERPAAVVADHVGQRGGEVNRPAPGLGGPGQVGVRAVQVPDGPLRVAPPGVLAQVGAARQLQRREAGGAALRRQADDEPQVAEHRLDELGAADRPVAGNDRAGAQPRQEVLQDVDGAQHRAGQQERGAAVEDQVPAEHHGALGDPHHDVVGRVGRPARVQQLAAQVIGPQGDLVGEGEERQGEFQVPVVGVGPHSGVVREAQQAHLGPRPLVGDDRGPGEQPVAGGVVGMMMGVDQRAHRRPGDAADGGQERPGAPLGGARVDGAHAGPADDEAGVVDHPGAVRLDVPEDAVRHLYQGELDGRVNVAMAHRRSPSAGGRALPASMPRVLPGVSRRRTGRGWRRRRAGRPR